MSEPKGQILRFGVFELDTEAEQLRKNGLMIRLQPQPYRLLKLLAAGAGRVVTRDEIRAALWKGDTFVDFDQGVNFAVKQVREALDDEAERSLYIQTVPKRGYRFVAPGKVMALRHLNEWEISAQEQKTVGATNANWVMLAEELQKIEPPSKK